MSDEKLETEITDGYRHARGYGQVRVKITADGAREDDFDAVRDAVKGVLGDE